MSHPRIHLPGLLYPTPTTTLHHYYEPSDPYAALLSSQVSPLHVHGLPDHSASNHPMSPIAALSRYPSARWALSHPRLSKLRLSLSGSPVSSGRIKFISYGLVVHLLLLPTSPHDDAVTFGYRPESACLRGTLTLLTLHAHGRTKGGFIRHRHNTVGDKPRPYVGGM
jgi:hypothetical protein